LVYAIARHPSDYFRVELLFWVVILVAIELLPVPSRRGLPLSLGFPIRLAVAILYPPPVAAAVAFVALFDVREWTGKRPLLLALLDRAQIALAVLTGSAVFHILASVHPPASPWFLLIPAVMAATVADYGVNVAIVALYVRWTTETPVRQILADMRLGSLPEFLLSYLGLSLIGAVIAKLYVSVELWAVVAFLLPLLFARRMFFRTVALEEATEKLKDRERLLRTLSNRMAEERHDERMQIAGYLHDELAQVLFRLALQVGAAKKDLAANDLDQLARHLSEMTEIKQHASTMVRALIRDLHRSAVGRAGLAEALRTFAADAERDSSTKVSVDVAKVSLPPAIQLLVYQIAREAGLNALKHGSPKHISIDLRPVGDGVELEVRDDGTGFDPTTKPAEGHFGLTMMNERARLAGGTLSVESAPGRGTRVVASLPSVWADEEGETEEQAQREPDTSTEPRDQATKAPSRSQDRAKASREPAKKAARRGRSPVAAQRRR
jgi:signal transduction histidine kinase